MSNNWSSVQTSAVRAVEYLDATAPIIMLLLSKQGEILQANAYARKLTGQSLVGQHFRDVVVDFVGQFDLAELADSLPADKLLTLNSATGLPYSLYCSFTAADDHLMVFGHQSIDELESMQQSILSLNQELSNLGRELQQKNAQLQRLSEEKNRFLGMASHDLRKPIGVMMTYTEFLLEEASDVLSADHVAFLDTIHTRSRLMKQIVDDFLDYSAIEAGKFPVNLHSASLPDVVHQCVAFLEWQARKKAVQLTTHCTANFPSFPMDSAKVEQAITNLVSNAIEYSPASGEVTINLSYDEHDVFFEVQDEGPGIPESEQSHLFKPFATTGVKKSPGDKSTGLGMLISRKVIEAHGGKITLHSHPGAGACIRFQLPRNGNVS